MMHRRGNRESFSEKLRVSNAAGVDGTDCLLIHLGSKYTGFND